MNSDLQTEELISRAALGDVAATEELLTRHRERLKRMVGARMDDRLLQRLDPSDVVQEAMLVAMQRLPQYFRERPVAFYPWLRQLTWERLVDLHRRHVLRQRRSVQREASGLLSMSNQSANEIAERLVTSDTGPSGQLLQGEMKDRIAKKLKSLPEKYCEVLVLRHFEQLSVAEAAEVLGIGHAAFKSRYYRAIQCMHERLHEAGEQPNA